MRRLAWFLILILVILAAPSVWAASNWWEVGAGSASAGGISNSSGASRYPSVAVDATGEPMVAWSDDTEALYSVYFKRYVSLAWGELDASATAGGLSGGAMGIAPTVIAGAGGNPVVGWPGRVIAWTGAAWEEWCSGSTCLVSHEEATPLVWDDLGVVAVLRPGAQPSVRRRAGSAWEPVGADEFPSDRISLAANAPDSIAALWVESGLVKLKKWNGAAWIGLGGSDISLMLWPGQMPCLAMTSAGRPVLAWTGAERCSLMWWTGASWESTSWDRYESGRLWSVDALTLDATDGPVMVGRLPGLNPANGYAWDIGIVRWNGSYLEEVGDGSAQPGGISRSAQRSSWPSVAISGGGKIFVAWQEGEAAGSQIWVKVYDPIYDIPGCAISINNGAAWTNSREVEICSSTSEAAWMLASNDAGFVGATWQPYTHTLPWTLEDMGERIVTQMVHVRLRAGDGSALCNGLTLIDDIVYDPLAPLILSADIESGEIAAQDNGTAVLRIVAYDQAGGSGVAEIQISAHADFTGAEWVPFAARTEIQAGPGQMLFIRVRDLAGNISKAVARRALLKSYLPLTIR